VLLLLVLQIEAVLCKVVLFKLISALVLIFGGSQFPRFFLHKVDGINRTRRSLHVVSERILVVFIKVLHILPIHLLLLVIRVFEATFAHSIKSK